MLQKCDWKKLLAILLIFSLGAGMLPGGTVLPRIVYTAAADEAASSSGQEGWIYRICEDGNAEIIGYEGDVSSLAIPYALGGAWVTRVAENAFANNPDLREITIPAAVTEISDTAFQQGNITLRAANGTEALRYAQKHGLKSINTSEYDLFDDILDLSEMRSAQFAISRNLLTVSAPYAGMICTGMKLFLPAVEGYSQGYPVEVLSVSMHGTTAEAVIRVMDFADTIETYHAENLTLTADYSRAVILADGFTLLTSQSRGTNIKKEASFGVSYEAPKGIRLEGNLTVSTDVTLDLDYEWFELKTYDHTVVNKAKIDLSVVGETPNFGDVFLDDKVPFARVPLVTSGLVTAWLEVALVVQIEGGISMEASVSVTDTLHWEKGKEPVVTHSTSGGDTAISIAASCTAGIQACLSVSLGFGDGDLSLDIAVLNLLLGVELKAESSTQMSGCMNVDINAKVTANIKLGILNDDKPRVALTMKLFDARWLLKTWHVELDPLTILDRCTKLRRVDICSFTDYAQESIDVVVDSKLPSLSRPERKGYEFTGWYLDRECTEAVPSSYRVTEDVTIYAGWTKVTPAPPKATNTPAPTATLVPPTPTPPTNNSEESLPYLKWRTGDNGITITGYLNNPTSITIPSHIDGVPVVAMEVGAFKDCVSLLYVSIPGTIETIPSSCFEDCENLAELVLHEGLKNIDSFAFNSCRQLSSVQLPDSVESLGGVSFGNCSRLSSVNIPLSLKHVGFIYSSGPFSGANLIRHMTVPEGMEHLPGSMFMYMGDLESVSLPSTLKSIGGQAFYDCTSLRSISLPSGLTELGNQAFVNCKKLRSIVIPDGVTAIPYHCFEGCDMVERIILPDGLKSIGDLGFAGCNMVTEVHLPDTIEELGSHAFGNCIELQKINIPLSLKKVGTYPSPFQSCAKLTSMTVPEGMVNLPAQLFEGMNPLQSVSLPSTLKTIGSKAFSGCKNLESIDLPKGLQSIGSSAFMDCDLFVSVTVPEGVTDIYQDAFANCDRLSSISLPDGLRYIGLCAINGCPSLTSLHLPDSVEELGANAIGNNANLSYVNIPLSLKKVDRYTAPFYNCPQLKHIDITEGMVELPDYLFNGVTSILSITLPTSLRKIGVNALSGTSIITLELPEGFTTLGARAFSGCKQLVKITIPGGVEIIPDECFQDCHALSNVTLNEGLVEISAYAFNFCKSLSSIRLPDSVEIIGRGAFGNNPVLTDVNIPISLETVTGSYTPFNNCPNLTSIVFPEGKTDVPASLFMDMGSLQEITLPDTIQTIGNSAFRYAGVKILYTPVRGSFAATWFTENYPDVKIVVVNENLCVVNFDSRGGTRVSSRKVGIGATLMEPSRPRREEYTFTGWYKDEACTMPWNFASDTAPSTGLTLYAGWDYTPTQYVFEVSGGSAVIVEYIGQDAYITLPEKYEGLPVTGLAAHAIPENVRSVHIPSAITLVEERAFRSAANLGVITVAEGHTVYRAVDGVLYDLSGTLHSYPRGKSSSEFTPAEGTHTIGDYAIVANSHLRVLNLPAGVKTLGNYAISGCEGLRRVACAADMTSIGAGCFMGNNENMRITGPLDAAQLASWADMLLVSYNEYNVIFMEGLELLGAAKMRAGKYFTPPEPDGKSEITFRGWSTKPDEVILWDFSTQPMPEHDLTLYAVWSLDFTVTPVDGGVALSGYSGANDPVIVPESVGGLPVLSIAPDTFPDSGVTLQGNKGSVTEAFAKAQGMEFVPFTYQVSFVSNGGSQPVPQQLCATDAVTPPSVLRTGYTLSGWYTDEALTQLWDFASDRVPAANMTLYAAWIKTDEAFSDVPFSFASTEDGLTITGYTGDETDVSIPDAINGVKVTAIADGAFKGNAILQHVTIPDTVKYIGASAFEDCRVLNSITLPDSVTDIGERAFAGCKALLSVTLPSNLTILEDSLFENCTYLADVSLPEKLQIISGNAFRGCSHLGSIMLGVDVSTVEASAFGGCDGLRTVSVAAENAYFMSVDGVLMSKDGSQLLLYPAGKTDESYTVPEGVRVIGENAMAHSRIRALTLPSTLTSIGPRALYGSLSLASVDFQNCDSLRTIGSGAFTGCVSLQGLVLPDSLESLGANAFSNCLLTSLTVPAGTVIGAQAIPAIQELCITGKAGSDAERYADQYGIRFIDLSRDIPIVGVKIDNEVTLMVGQTYQLEPELVPEDTTETKLTFTSENPAVATVNADGMLTAHAEGMAIINILALNGSVVQCAVTVEHADDTPAAITLERSEICIALGAAIPLQAVVYPPNADHTLKWSSSDENVAVFSSGCIVSLGEGTATLTAETSNGLQASCMVTVCVPLANSDVFLPAGLTFIEAEAFMGTDLSSVILPRRLESIGARAFADCPSLRQISIPASVSSIDATAFSGCSSLTIYAPIGSYAERFAQENGIPFAAE